MQAVFFDLFETLITHFDPDWSPPSRTIAERLGIGDDVYAAAWSGIDQRWQAGEIETYTEALERLSTETGSTPQCDVFAELAREYDQMTRQAYGGIEPEIVNTLARLRQAGLKLGVITNAGDLDAAPWPGCELSDYFDDFIASHQVGMLKRDPRIFDLACQRLDVEPEETIFVGDGGGNELRGAAEAGLNVYWCTWFLDRWPAGIRPNGFPGDDWRQHAEVQDPPFDRLTNPRDLLVRLRIAP